MLPNFLGIGVPRGGTTWLHNLLASHPDVYAPDRRKEVHFFDRYYDRGIAWYEGFFPRGSNAGAFAAVGEITPHYLYCRDCPSRIADLKTVSRLLLILRNPIERAYSHYRWRVRLENYRANFETFLEERPQAVEWGLYAKYLRNYLEYFDRNRILILIHEMALNDVPQTRQRLARFLGIDPDQFPPQAGMNRLNEGIVPKFRIAFKLFSRFAAVCRRSDLDWIPNLGNKLHTKRLFGKSTINPPKPSEAARICLRQVFEPDIKELESILTMELSFWQ